MAPDLIQRLKVSA